MTATAATVKAANKLSSADLKAHLSFTPATACLDQKYALMLRSAPFLPAEQIALFKLFELNMKELYRPSSFGWRPKEKKLELFSKSSRFIVLRSRTLPVETVAYLMWRFDTEENEEGKEEPIIYLYELQVSSSHQKEGFGRLLVENVERIGSETGMRRVLLTVLKANLPARSFYERIGYHIDSTSPSVENGCTEGEASACDYEILSKAL